LALPVLTLTVAMIQPAFGTLLVPAIGTATLAHPGLLAAGLTAIALAAVAAGAKKESRLAVAREANALPQNHFAHRHVPSCGGAGQRL